MAPEKYITNVIELIEFLEKNNPNNILTVCNLSPNDFQKYVGKLEMIENIKKITNYKNIKRINNGQ